MTEFLDKTRRFLWAFVELAFLALLAIVLFYLLVGQSSGAYVLSVVDNITKFAGGIPTPSLIGMAIVGLLAYIAVQRLR
jgi:hypothetical protein